MAKKIAFFNTAAREKQSFVPLEENKVTLYTCGPTVYATPHMGNWIAYIRWDTLVRTLEMSGHEVERVMNITDVGHLTGDNEGDADTGEDKMEKGARLEGITAWDVAERYTDEFIKGMRALHLKQPTHLTKATEHIEAQLDLVRTLKAKGYTYQITDGIYFDTAKFKPYAEFAKLDLEALRAGARVEHNTQKRNANDFALWKFSPTDKKRDMEWATPQDLLETEGASKMGFPGWHLECSAMAMQYLGPTIDIHTGGIDHIPVHHTNEIAQSEAATGKQFSHFWLHNAHLLANGTKISKSLGNGYTLKDIIKKGYSALDFKLFVLQSHYRTEGNFSFENLKAAKNRLLKWQNIASLRWQTFENTPGIEGLEARLATARDSVLLSMQNDMDTPDALKIIDEIFSELESGMLSKAQTRPLIDFFNFLDQLFGLELLNSSGDISAEQKGLIAMRHQARQNQNWAEADRLREQLLKANITLDDKSHGSIWSRT